MSAEPGAKQELIEVHSQSAQAVFEECLDQLILPGERSLHHALDEYLTHHQNARNHHVLDNVIPFPNAQTLSQAGAIHKAERLGGLLNFPYPVAA